MQGALFMLAAVTIFAVQDGLSKHLASQYPAILVVMIRYWAFGLFVVALSARRAGGLRAAIRSERPGLQMLRGLLLVAEVTLITWVFAQFGLAATHSFLAACPLITAMLAAQFLGERLDAVRWGAIGLGFAGVLTIMRPGVEAIDPLALAALGAALMFSAYNILTRMAGASDRASVSFFYTGVFGALGATLVGPFFAEPIAMRDWPYMAALCVTGTFGHYLVIRAYQMTEASRLQPYTYAQLALVTLIGWWVYGEQLDMLSLIGTGMIVVAGLFCIAQERRLASAEAARQADREAEIHAAARR